MSLIKIDYERTDVKTKAKRIAFKLIGAGIYAGAGCLAGEALEHVPYMNQTLANFAGCAIDKMTGRNEQDKEFFHRYIVVDREDRTNHYVWYAWFKGQRSRNETIGDSQLDAIERLVEGLEDWEYWTICRRDEGGSE